MRFKKIILAILIFLPGIIFGQFSFLDDPYDDLEVEFLREKIEGKAKESFFNVIKITNPTDRRLQFNTYISIPKGWKLMDENRKTITLQPNDSILLPIRGSISPKAKGEIGYALVASLTNSKGVSFKNKYSFINIPKYSRIKFRPTNRNYYFDNLTKEATIKFHIVNKGNIDEVIYLNFEYDKGIKMENGSKQELKTEFTLTPSSDTTVSFNVKYLNEKTQTYGDRVNYRIHVKASTKDTSTSNIIWLKKINQNYTNFIPDRNRLLILELSALNIFSEYDPTYNLSLRGSLLTKKSGSLFYSFQTLGQRFAEDPWRYSRTRVNYTYKGQTIELGEINDNVDQSLYGKGAAIKLNIKKQEFKILASQNLSNRSTKYGSIVKIRPYKNSYFELGGVFAENEKLNQNNYLGIAGFYIPLLKNLNIYIRGGISETNFTDFNKSSIGFGNQTKLYFTKNNIRFSSSLQIADRQYKGVYAGRLSFNNILNYKINDKTRLFFNSTIFNNNPPVYDDAELLPDKYFNSNISFAQIFHILNPNLSIYGGPRLEIKASNNFYNFNSQSEFSVPTSYLIGGVKIRSTESAMSVNLKTAIGYSIVSPDINGLNDKTLHHNQVNYPSIEISARIMGRIWSIYTSYFEGPYTLSQHFAKVYYSSGTRLVRVMPQINFFAFNNLIKISNRSNFNFDLNAKSSRYNITTVINGHPGRGWRLQLLNTIGYQTSFDDVVEEKYSFSNTYFEFRVEKKFGFNQPRVQYHDLTIVFFKDLNGDGEKGNDEPGIESVLAKVDINRSINDSMQQIYNPNSGGFYATELLSDLKGVIKYKNLPSGFYTINYVSLGKMQGNYSSDKSQENFIMDKDKAIYIPYKENNKIFGSVIMNRSKLSNLGNLPAANIKITATDSKNNVISTLTDKNGNFTLYVPSVDKYKIHMNNIYYEHFNLAQNDFTVELNGYKQFEINFILNEKRRRINFSNNLDYASQEKNVRVIKRTNLGGTVKDAATFKPIKADVKIIDSETGRVVTSDKSNGNTGQFYVSYLAGKKYKLVVMSDGYWFYSENLPADQITTFQNIKREIMLNYITVGSTVNLQAITFEPGQDNLTPEAMAELDRLAGILQNNPGLELEVVGHCDAIEAVDNIEVAENRAKSVMTYLMKKGFNNLRYSSAGDSQPLNEGNTEEQRAKNRRVEAIVISK